MFDDERSAVIADVPKTWVFRIARWLNDTRGTDLIPGAVLTKEDGDLL